MGYPKPLAKRADAERCTERRGEIRCQLYAAHPASLHASMIAGNQIVFWGERAEQYSQPVYQLPWAPAFPTVE
jgi:hypothetical protein